MNATTGCDNLREDKSSWITNHRRGLQNQIHRRDLVLTIPNMDLTMIFLCVRASPPPRRSRVTSSSEESNYEQT